MNFSGAIKSGFRNSFNFSGRAMRSEYWYFTLFYSFCDVAGTISTMTTAGTGLGRIVANLWLLVLLVLVVPHIAVASRRLHDTNHSGWWYGALLAMAIVARSLPERASIPASLLAIMAFILLLILLRWLVQLGASGPNRFGPPVTDIPDAAPLD